MEKKIPYLLRLFFVAAILYSCCANKPAHIVTTEKFVECVNQGRPDNVESYSTEPTAKLVHKLLRDTLCFDESDNIKECPGFREMVKSISGQNPKEDGTYTWPRIAKDSISKDGRKAWVWLEYPKDGRTSNYELALINVDRVWLVDLPILE